MGRMDCFSSYNTDRGQWGRDVRNAEDACQQKSTEEEDSGERGDERRKLL